MTETRRAWLTPDSPAVGTICRTLNIPNILGFLVAVEGALIELCYAYSWEQFGALTPDQSAELMYVMWKDFVNQKGSCRMVGEIIPYAGQTSPDPNWLFCDGQSLLRTDYPTLFSIIGTLYGSADSLHFNIPDMRGNVGLGANEREPSITYSAGNQGGEVSHTLTTAQIPAHTHSDLGHTHTVVNAVTTLIPVGVGAAAPAAIAAPSVTGLASANIQNTGGGGAHNNLQPYLVINYLIV